MSTGLMFVLVGIVLFSWARYGGTFLVVNELRKADAIVVLGGDVNDRRYWTGIELLHSGYGRELFVDAADQIVTFGHTDAEWARRFIAETNPNSSESVNVCPVGDDSTVGETKYVQACLANTHATSVLLVSSDFHTRRALSIFRNRLPMYTWYVVGADDPTQFGTRWWLHREWAKRTAEEWEKLLWWDCAERWVPASS